MEDQSEIIKRCLDYIILVTELNEVSRLKHLAVREQSFELAVKFRQEENALLAKVPSLDQIREMRSLLK